MKGQVSVEFIAYLSFTLFVSAVLMGVLQDKQANYLQTEEEREAEELASRVSYIAEYALTKKNTSFNVRLPLQISSEDYSITVESGTTRILIGGEVVRSLNNYEGRVIQIKSGGRYEVVNNGSVYFQER
ncbi:hypothetical protein GKQ38_03885 [Candidatus Nanohaloarchaea archaeon]|nr:hypothetical protein GKQ38_03885 [Candidatus Nanohaloarchaea archaeon]